MNLRDLRKQRGLTQQQVATLSGITTRAYQYYESMEKLPSVVTAIAIARVLKVSVEEIWA